MHRPSAVILAFATLLPLPAVAGDAADAPDGAASGFTSDARPAGASAGVTVGLKNFRQLLAAFAAATGVDPTQQDLAAYFAAARTRLPKRGRVEELSSPGLLTAAALAGFFCSSMITTDSGLAPSARHAHKQVDFTQPPAGLTAAVRASVLAEYAGLFWRRDATPTEVAALDTVFDEATAASGATPQDTLAVLRPVCTAVASSLESLIN